MRGDSPPSGPRQVCDDPTIRLTTAHAEPSKDVTPVSEPATETFPADETLTRERARELGYELGLRGDEYDRVEETLGRIPTVSELGMYSVMWSEHASYKSSKVHLRELPTTGPQVLVGPGENAGVVDVGDGLAVSFKIESHNHPSFVEPYQGAATGVGGILRDIFTMGARPIAIMDPLRFGDPGGWTDGAGNTREPDLLQRHLVDGVVRGVGGYGNCVGVPNIGGETVFDDSYADNPLVNVLAVGVLRRDRLQLARAESPGDKAVLLGSATGRDGIGGASVLASQEFDEGLDAKRPNVQVGDPFAEKLLIECCLELYERDLISGIQDMGAAGIACSTAELASAASMGMDVDLDKVHLREPSMESWEILCSESQERMLALVSPEHLDEVLAVAEHYGVPASVIGEVVEGDDLVLRRRGEVVARTPARSLADEGPVYDRPYARPDWLDDLQAADAESLVVPGLDGSDGDFEEFVLRYLASPNVASKAWVIDQYDQLVLGGTVLGPGMAGAGVVRLPGSRKGVACATDGNGRWCLLDPREGTKRVIAEAFRNVACTGARPLATTNCLNFGTRSARTSCGSSPSRSPGWARPARRWASRSPAATCRCTTRPAAGRSTRHRWWACWACSRTPRTPWARPSRTRATWCSSWAPTPPRGWPAASFSGSWAVPPRAGSPPSTSTSRGHWARCWPSRSAKAGCRARTTCRAAACWSPSWSRACWVRWVSRCPCPRGWPRCRPCSASPRVGWWSRCRHGTCAPSRSCAPTPRCRCATSAPSGASGS
jgi:phosphoribosylformylglycinamidine synthase II